MKKYLVLGVVFLGVVFTAIIFSNDLVSATCCQVDANGLTCQENVACDNLYSSSPNACNIKGSFCESGYCLDLEEGWCSSGSPKFECEEEDGGQWFKERTGTACEVGCCYIGENTDPMTQKRCEVLAQRHSYKDYSFVLGVPEEQCKYFSGNFGACVHGGSCTITDEESCSREYNGQFYEENFCSDSELGLNYESQKSKGCYENDIYWFDSGGNREGLIKECVDRAEICEIGSDGPYCKSTLCNDTINNKMRINGESWCNYEGYVGDGKDLVGSEHYRLYCEDGEIKVYLETSSFGRNMICAESIDGGISVATLRKNNWKDCLFIDDLDFCDQTLDCKVVSIDVAEYFKFDTCVPKYPPGFDLTSTNPVENGKDVCGLATKTIEEAWDDDGWLSSDDCEANCGYDWVGFVTQMNNLCTSMGDCGISISYAGDKSESFEITTNGRKGTLEMCYLYGLTGEIPQKYRYVFTNPFEDYNEERVQREIENACAEYFVAKRNFLTTEQSIGTFLSLTKENVIGDNTPHPKDLKSNAKNLPEELTTINEISLDDYYGKRDYTKQFTFVCKPWEPPSNGDNCSLCNGDPFAPCTEYKCHSLGKSCEILDNTNQICYNKYSKETDPPEISFKSIEGNYKFVEGNNGAQIKSPDGVTCPQKGNRLNFTIQTDEPAQCKWSYTSVFGFENMENNFIENGDWSYEHRIENLKLNQDDRLRLYARCIDPNTNYNHAEYIIDICVSPEPDAKMPDIESFSPEDESFLKLGKTQTQLRIILDGAAQCKYDLTPNIAYENMQNNLSCNFNDSFANENFCETQLQSLTEFENKIYIKCNDTSGNFNINDEVYTLFATQEALRIDSTLPTEGVVRERPITKAAPLTLKVITGGGAYNGVSTCRFSFEGNYWKDDFLENSKTHEYQITSNISNGNYSVKFTCEDKAGNEAEKVLNFFVDIDSSAPVIISQNRAGENLEIETNEDAECYYRNDRAQFSTTDATSITTGFDTKHTIRDYASWMNYYVRCKDLYGNENVTIINSTETDNGAAPKIVRIYKDLSGFGEKLKVITDKHAKCYYYTDGCSFSLSLGNLMTNSAQGFSRRHETEWNPQKTYYIKCEDVYGNKPTNATCNAIIHPI